MNSELYRKYFPDIDEKKIILLREFKQIFLEWNQKVNMISRKDTDSFEVNHVLHSLSIAKAFNFIKDSEVLDFGTGGGFPGIPLAIFFPGVKFTLIDSIGKKMKVVESVKTSLNLKNIEVVTGRVEDLKHKYDFVTCRAVGRLNKILPWVEGSLKKKGKNEKPNGFIFLKGGDLSEELSEVRIPHKLIPVSKLFDEPFFETKEIVYLSKHL